MNNLPFKLIEIKVPKSWSDENNCWHPNDQLYMVQYKWPKDKTPNYFIGKFYPVWYGYSFHGFWMAANLQLSTDHDLDLKRFERIWEFYHEYKKVNFTNEYITDADIKL